MGDKLWMPGRPALSEWRLLEAILPDAPPLRAGFVGFRPPECSRGTCGTVYSGADWRGLRMAPGCGWV